MSFKLSLSVLLCIAVAGECVVGLRLTGGCVCVCVRVL